MNSWWLLVEWPPPRGRESSLTNSALARYIERVPLLPVFPCLSGKRTNDAARSRPARVVGLIAVVIHCLIVRLRVRGSSGQGEGLRHIRLVTSDIDYSSLYVRTDSLIRLHS